MKKHWQKKLTAFDAQLCKMVESLTQRPCEPKNGGDHYFIEIDYTNNTDTQFVSAMRLAIEGRAGNRLVEIKDDPKRHCLLAQIKFYDGQCKDAAFIPKIETES